MLLAIAWLPMCVLVSVLRMPLLIMGLATRMLAACHAAVDIEQARAHRSLLY